MKPRELAAFLRILNAAGVASYTSKDLSITFREPVATPVDMNEPTEDDQLNLPEGVYDPLAKLREINRKVRQ